MTCPRCSIRVGPCVDEHGAPIAQYHRERVAAEAHPPSHTEEQIRLQAAERAGERSGR